MSDIRATQPEKTIAMGDALRYGWHMLKRNFRFFVVFMILYYGILFAVGGVIEYFLFGKPLLYATGQVVSSLLSAYLGIGFVLVGLFLVDKKQPSYSLLFQGGPFLWRTILLYLLMALIVAAPIIVGILISLGIVVPAMGEGIEHLKLLSFAIPVLLAIPAIVWAIKFSMAFYLIIDKKQEVIASLKQSAQLTDGVKWELLAFFIVTGAVNLLGLIALVIGLFITIPVTFMAYIYVYRKLTGHAPPLAGEAPADPTS